MREALHLLLGGGRTVQRDGFSLRLLSAWEVIQAQQEAEEQGGGETLGLWRNACILARAAVRAGAAVFPDGQSVLRQWTPEKIEGEMAAYRGLSERSGSCGQSVEETERLVEALHELPMERIRWKVQRAFGALPTERRVREMTEADYLYCAVQMIADREDRLSRLCPSCRARTEEARCACCGKRLPQEQAGNPQFDERRFEELRDNGGELADTDTGAAAGGQRGGAAADDGADGKYGPDSGGDG